MSSKKARAAARREKAAAKKIQEEHAVDFSFLKKEKVPGPGSKTRRRGRRR